MPYHHYQLNSSFTPEQIAQALSDNIRSPRPTISDMFRMSFGVLGKWLGRRDDGGTWYGTANHHRFKIYRHISYRNSFLPVVIGTIQRTPTGSQVDVVMRLHWSVWLVLGLFVLVGLSILFEGVMTPTADKMLLVVPIGILVFVSVLAGVGFWAEVNKAKELLAEQLHAT